MGFTWGGLQTVLVIDTESYVDMQSGQRRLLALSFEIISVDNEEVQQSGSYIIAPRGGYHPDARSARVHGLTAKEVAGSGTDVELVLTKLATLMLSVDALVAHDITADVAVLVTEAVMVSHHSALEALIRISHVCTKIESTSLCSIPLCNISGWKWPSLVEAGKTLLGEDWRRDIATHHSCPEDVRMCSRVFLRICQIHTQ